VRAETLPVLCMSPQRMTFVFLFVLATDISRWTFLLLLSLLIYLTICSAEW
jgi:hypothetical protein